MELSIVTYSHKPWDHRCNKCGGVIPAGDDMLNITLNDCRDDEDNHCDTEHDILLCHACAKELFEWDEIIKFLIRGA